MPIQEDVVEADVVVTPASPGLAQQTETAVPESLDSTHQAAAMDETQSLRVENHGISKMSVLVAPSLDELMREPLAARISVEMAEEIRNARELGVFQTADKFALRYMKEVVIPSLGLDDRQREAATMVVERKNLSLVKTEERQSFMRLSHLQEVMSRRLLKYMIGNENVESRGFRPMEVAELSTGMEIADEMDNWYMKWEGEQHDMPEVGDREALGFKSRWHFVKGSQDEGFKEVPNSELFPEEHARVSELLGKMIEQLVALRKEGEVDADLESKIKLYEVYKKAHDTSDTEAVHAAWEEVEIAYAQQKGRIITVTPQEYGYANNANGIIPDISYRFKVGEATGENPLAAGINKKRTQIQQDLPLVLRDMPHAVTDISKIPMPELTYFAVNGGCSGLVFQIAGQALPNTKKIQTQYGSLTTTNAEAMRKRVEEAKALFRGIFGDKYDAELAAIDSDEVIVNVGVHEMGHNIGDKDVFANSLNRQALEEWKATATEWVLMHLDESLTDEQLRSAMLAEILHALRYTQKRNDPTTKPYYQGWLSFMKTAQELGIIVQNEGKPDLDLDVQKIKGYAAEITAQWIYLQAKYEEARTGKEGDDAVKLQAAQTSVETIYAKDLVKTPIIDATQEMCDKLAA